MDELTPRQRQILSLLYLSNQAIADRLGLAEQTVKNQTWAIYSKLFPSLPVACNLRVLAFAMWLKSESHAVDLEGLM